MSKENIESHIPKALEVLDIKFHDGSISSTFVGYISAFGVSLVQIGLLPTVALHEKEERREINELVLQILAPDTNDTLSLLEYILSRPESEYATLKEELKDIAVALKLCMRTFKLDKGGQNE